MNTLHAPHGVKLSVSVWLLAQLPRKRLDWLYQKEPDLWAKK